MPLTIKINATIKGLFTVATLLFSLTTNAQIKDTEAQDTLQQVISNRMADYETLTDAKNGSTVYKGVFAFRDMAAQTSFTWLQPGINEYKPKKKYVNYLSKNIKSYKMLVFLGTWCSDSKDMMPKLFKVLDAAHISYDNLMMVGMDREKTTTTNIGKELIEKYQIKFLPTIILVNQSGHEVGRITETVQKSLEYDLAQIIKTVE